MPLAAAFLTFLFHALVVADPTDKALSWGPYRPNLYFGVRSRVPNGPIFGMMWGSVDDGKLNSRKLRHACEQSDGLANYGWTTYDPRNGGVENISDPHNKVNLTLEFVKFPDRLDEWSLRISGMPLGRTKKLSSTVIFYLGVEDENSGNSSHISCTPSADGMVSCQGDAYYISIPPPVSNGKGSTALRSLRVAKDMLWQAKSLLLNEDNSMDISLASQPDSGNLHFVQRSFDSSFSFDIHFTSDHAAAAKTAASLTERIHGAESAFDSQFQAAFAPDQRWLGNKYTKFSKSLLSNLMGGIGYFYGDDRVNLPSSSSKTLSRVRSKKHELFTMVPSRSFFPRGFLWDEGFHLLVVIRWDLDLALEIIQSWFALMDEDGWIGREQILGPEARSKVPKEFQTQNLDYANPPTLFLVVEAFLEIASGKKPYHGAKSRHLQPGAARTFIVELFPKLKTHYDWWRRTQKGDLDYVDEDKHIHRGFRWRGQTATHVLTCGLDDYPRTNPPHPTDLHVDALSWVSMMARILAKVVEYLEGKYSLEAFAQQKEQFDRGLEFLHWSEVDQAYCDTTDRSDAWTYECHKGYISIFPFLLGSLNASHPHLNATLSLMRDEKELWTPFGLRSLSRSDKLYGTEENYWRSPIWININYLAIIKLRELAQETGPHREIARTMYNDLRQNIISTVYNSWLATGFAWEQYNPETGAGQRTQGFTGWTALVVNLLAMPDLTNAYANPDAVESSYEVPMPQASPIQRNDYTGILFFFFVFVVPTLGAAFALKAVWSRWFGRPGFTGVVRERRPNTGLYVRLNHMRSFMPSGL